MWKLFFCSSCLCLLVGVGPSFSEKGPQRLDLADEGPAVETRITSEKMTVRNREQEAVFETNVVLVKHSLSLTVFADRMVVFFAQKKSNKDGEAPPLHMQSAGSSPNHSIQRIEASGHVRIKKDQGKATCQKAVYFEREQRVVLTGHPVAWQAGNRISGKRIILYLAEDRTVVEGGSEVIVIEPRESGP